MRDAISASTSSIFDVRCKVAGGAIAACASLPAAVAVRLELECHRGAVTEAASTKSEQKAE